MTWLDAVKLRQGLLERQEGERQRIVAFASLELLMRFVLFSPDCKISKEFASCIVITDYGNNLLKSVNLDAFSPEDISLACFMIFFHRDFVIDTSASSLEQLVYLINKQINSGSILLPERSLRDLYDKFNDLPGDDRLEKMDANGTFNLVAGTEQGVYQIGNLITGPLGLFFSEHIRYFPPRATLPPWHCADPGCGFLHEVAIVRHKHSVFDAFQLIHRKFRKVEGEASEWNDIVRGYFSRIKRRTLNLSNDLPSLLREAFAEPEQRIILALALQLHGKKIRETLLISSMKLLARKPDEKIVAELSIASVCQLLLSMEDAILVRLIDECIFTKKIKIPLSEVRQAKSMPYNTTVFGKRGAISNLGFRGEQSEPVELFCYLVWAAYENSNLLSELAWRCAKKDQIPHKSEPINYLKTHSVRETVNDLIISSQPIARFICDALYFNFDNECPLSVNIDRLLWKFGFNPPRFDKRLDRLLHQVDDLASQVIDRGRTLDDDSRDAIRSAGVNVFVAFERIMEEIIAFNVWLLASDHFYVTGFEYSHADAVIMVAERLGDTVESGSFVARWDRNGNNVIGVLLVYARKAAKWMRDLATKDASSVRRCSAKLPFFAIEVSPDFPLAHSELWADASREELSSFSQTFDSIIQKIEAATPAEIRNGLDHFREEDRFPLSDQILACCERLKRALKDALLTRIYPKNYWYKSVLSTSSGLSEYELEDASGARLCLGYPSNLEGLKGIVVNQALIVPHGNLLGRPNADLLIRTREKSQYASKWSVFPRRRMPVLNME